jgi:hypothetical protein
MDYGIAFAWIMLCTGAVGLAFVLGGLAYMFMTMMLLGVALLLLAAWN